MPLLNIEKINSFSSWALWEITETEEAFEGLYRELGCTSDIPEGLKLKRKEWLAGRVLVRQLLNKFSGVTAEIVTDDNGRPYLNGLDYQISISHCKRYAAAIIHQNKKVGIDIELIQEKIEKISTKFLSDRELNYKVLSLEEKTTYWALKEVLYKVYSMKKLSLKNNIYIQPFKLEEKGFCAGEILAENRIEKYNLKYIRFNQHILAFNYYV